MENEKVKWAQKLKDNKTPVSVDDVYEIISEMTGVPISKLDTKETKKLLELETILSSKVIRFDSVNDLVIIFYSLLQNMYFF